MTKFDAVCTLLDLKTKEEKLTFLVEASAAIALDDYTTKVKTTRKTVAKKGKRGRRKKTETSQTTGV